MGGDKVTHSKTPVVSGQPASRSLQRKIRGVKLIDQDDVGSRAGLSGNVADIIGLINANGKSSDTASMVNYEWMAKLREGSRKRGVI